MKLSEQYKQPIDASKERPTEEEINEGDRVYTVRDDKTRRYGVVTKKWFPLFDVLFFGEEEPSTIHRDWLQRSYLKFSPKDNAGVTNFDPKEAELAKLKQGYQRYEKLRKLNVPQFKALYIKCMSELCFDEEVDKLP